MREITGKLREVYLANVFRRLAARGAGEGLDSKRTVKSLLCGQKLLYML
jgi:hypothetical protein